MIAGHEEGQMTGGHMLAGHMMWSHVTASHMMGGCVTGHVMKVVKSPCKVEFGKTEDICQELIRGGSGMCISGFSCLVCFSHWIQDSVWEGSSVTWCKLQCAVNDNS